MANPPKLPPSVVNSDVAVGHVLGLECKAAFKAEKAGELFIHNYYSCDADGLVSQRQLAGSGTGTSKQSMLDMYAAPPTPLLNAISVHPIKTTAEFVRFHQQVASNFRPPLVGPKALHSRDGERGFTSDYTGRKFKKRYGQYFMGSCMANVASQICKYKEIRPPCYYRPSMAVAWPLDVANIVLSSEPQDAEATKSLERTELKTHVREAAAHVALPADLPEVAINGQMHRLTAEEYGYRRNTAALMREWLAESADAVVDGTTDTGPALFVVDANAHCQPALKMRYAQLDSYCLDGLSSGFGVLKLSSHVDGLGAFPDLSGGEAVGGQHLIDYELSMTGSKCYSGHAAVRGSVATVYSAGAVPIVLKWLEENESLPFDYVFPYLAELGVPVRATEDSLCRGKRGRRGAASTAK
jgi:hypothetical protein